MAYLQFNKQELGNLEYSLKREILATNRAGGYFNTTLAGCNTRKYHGLLVVPLDAFGGENHVMLSSLDETVVQHSQAFNLGLHRYPGIYDPRGHKYIIDFEMGQSLSVVYRVGGVILKKDILLAHNRDQLMLRYTLLEAHSPTKLRFKPFLAFRNAHSLTHANLEANRFHRVVDHGIGCRLYDGFPTLFMQLNVKNEFISCPDWYKNIEYLQEKARGYDYREDLFVPGYFECDIKKGQSIVFSASLQEEKPTLLQGLYKKELALRPSRDSYIDCLKLAASQFIIKRGDATEIVAGYPWFGRWGRDTFISLPGLTLAANKNVPACKAVLDTMVRDLRGGLFPNIGKDENAAYNSVDAPLWFFWAVQQYLDEIKDPRQVWSDYGEAFKAILQAYKNGTSGVKMHANGLIWAAQQGRALTWMDAVVEGVPVTPRAGYDVEIAALWYNAVCFALSLARQFDDASFVAEFEEIPHLVEENFYATFWVEKRGHLADYVDEKGQNIFTRPNQIIACSLPYSPITDEVKHKVWEACTKELLTPRGLRTLSPRNPLFEGLYEGNQATRDRAYHQGTVWPWLLGPYIETAFRLHGPAYVERAKELVNAFEEDITEHGVGSIAEVYDGTPPYHPHGCTSQAWSVAGILRVMKLISKYNNQ